MNRVLVVVDMQKDFIDGSLASEGGTELVQKVAEKIRGFEGRVVYTLDTHQENYLDTQEGKNLPVLHCQKGTPGWMLPEEIQRSLDDRGATAYEKPSFGSPELVLDLAEQNRQEAIEEIVLLGICTDICVLTNALALKCFLPEVPLKVEASCCAGVTGERHNTALEAMSFCQIEIR